MLEVLIVDDDFMVARSHQRIVDTLPGFRVIGVAHSGKEALELISELKPHLVLLDIYLPDMSGLEVLRCTRELGYDLDFIVLSAARETETISGALQGGIVSYVLKPFLMTALQARLAWYAERHKLFSRSGSFNQSELDEALGRGPVTLAEELPKGLSKETSVLVEQALQQNSNGLAALECAEEIGISRVVARRYLEHFVRAGLARVSLRYGQTGRPQRRYSWIEQTGE